MHDVLACICHGYHQVALETGLAVVKRTNFKALSNVQNIIVLHVIRSARIEQTSQTSLRYFEADKTMETPRTRSLKILEVFSDLLM